MVATLFLANFDASYPFGSMMSTCGRTSVDPGRARLASEANFNSPTVTEGACSLFPSRASIDVEINAKQTHLGPFDTATDGYTLLGLDAGIARRLGSRPIRFDIRVRNLTDKAYKSFLSRYKSFALDPGRNVLVRLSMDF